MENKGFAFFFVFISSAFFATAQSDSAAKEAIKMRNNIDVYLQENLGNKPITNKEKLMANKIDSLVNLTRQLSNQISALEKSPKPTQVNQGLSRQTYSVYFSSNSCVISQDGIAMIEKIVNQYPNASFEIKGYADAYGNADYNLNLSMKRASDIRLKLKGLLPNSNIEIVAAEHNKNAINSTAHLFRKVDIIVQ